MYSKHRILFQVFLWRERDTSSDLPNEYYWIDYGIWSFFFPTLLKNGNTAISYLKLLKVRQGWWCDSSKDWWSLDACNVFCGMFSSRKIENKTYKTVNLKHWCRWSFQRGELCCASCGNSHKTTNFLDDSWLQNLNSGIRTFRDCWNLNVFLFSFNSVYRTKILLRMDEFM